jgi:hypothetical protein
MKISREARVENIKGEVQGRVRVAVREVRVNDHLSGHLCREDLWAIDSSRQQPAMQVVSGLFDQLREDLGGE